MIPDLSDGAVESHPSKTGQGWGTRAWIFLSQDS